MLAKPPVDRPHSIGVQGGSDLRKCLHFGGALLLSALLGACNVRVTPEETLVLRYSEGIQSQHQDTYENAYLLCHPDAPFKNLEHRLTEYKKLRRTGSITFSSDGIEIIKISTLGRGAFYRVEESSSAGDMLRVRTLIKPEYPSINYRSFPPRAIVYVLGEPFGKVLPIRILPGYEPPEGPLRRVLRSVELEWRWVRWPESSLEWCLESLLPVPDTAVYQDLQFRELQPTPTGP